MYVAAGSLHPALTFLVRGFRVPRIQTCLCRLFDRTAAKHFDGWHNHGKRLKHKYFRSRNNKDPVCIVPGMPYVHVGTEIYIDKL